jgi:hypothetical protein
MYVSLVLAIAKLKNELGDRELGIGNWAMGNGQWELRIVILLACPMPYDPAQFPDYLGIKNGFSNKFCHLPTCRQRFSVVGEYDRRSLPNLAR